MPVDAFDPNTKAKMTTANILVPFNPALARPTIIAAENASKYSNESFCSNVINQRESYTRFNNMIKRNCTMKCV